MKSYLTGIIERKSDEYKKLEERNETAETVEELRSIGVQMRSLMNEIEEAKRQLASLDAGEPEQRGLNPIASYGMKQVPSVEHDTDVRSSMEYRKAFMDYVQTGRRADILLEARSEGVSDDLGILLPETIVQSIMTEVSKVYGKLYNKVRKTNMKGGVKYPIGEFSVQVRWDGENGDDPEHGVTNYQKVGQITGYVEFSYHIAEMRIAQSLLQQILTVPAFEAEITKAFLEAHVRDMDQMILYGNGVTQPEGILTEYKKGSGVCRIPDSQIIDFTEDEIADWKVWINKLFAEIPLAMTDINAEFMMTKPTWMRQIMTLTDDNNRPLASEVANATPGVRGTEKSFYGYPVSLIEPDGIENFDLAEDGDIFGIFWVPNEAYVINSQMQFSQYTWVDHETNQKKTKGILVCDGKLLDTQYIWLLRKKVSNSDEPEVTA